MKKLSMLLFISILSLVLSACGEKTTNDELGNYLTGEINIYTRDAVSGTREAFESIVGFKSNELAASAIETTGNGDMATKVGNDQYAIGYASLSTDFEANNIRTLKFEGVEATEENVINGTYTLQRPFSYTTREADDFGNDDVKNMTAAFIAFMGTKDGIAVLNSKHVIIDGSTAPTWNSIKEQYPIVNNATDITVRMGGSTSVEASVESVAEAFKATAPAFAYTMNQTGSGDGFKRTLGVNKDNMPVEIGFASRTFNTEEDITSAFKSGIIGKDAIAVVVEKENPLTTITKAQLKNIFIGQIKNWEDLSK
ncbi:MAG: hypothetical protein K0Q49_1303 [Haloplasmataceae bacterium]|jgi:phosphate transport system substrate-binding protein|nr:hypothetical protein [Haloplasmataceae bacterium]